MVTDRVRLKNGLTLVHLFLEFWNEEILLSASCTGEQAVWGMVITNVLTHTHLIVI